MSQPIEAARFERIRNLLEMVRRITALLPGIDLSKIGELVAAFTNFAGITSDPKTEAGIIDRVTAGLGIAKLLAAMTATTADDSFVSLIENITGNPDTLKWIAGLVASLLAKAPAAGMTMQALEATIEAETQTVPVSASGLDLSQIIALVKLLFELISQFTKK